MYFWHQISVSVVQIRSGVDGSGGRVSASAVALDLDADLNEECDQYSGSCQAFPQALADDIYEYENFSVCDLG